MGGTKQPEKFGRGASADGGEASVVIIGSGPCGAMAAHELVRRSIPVTMLESGVGVPRGAMMRVAGHPTFRWVDDSAIRWDTGFTPTLDPRTTWYRALVGGGLSNFWTGAVPRFSRSDFGRPGGDEALRWPIGYDDLVPHYERSELVIGVTGSDKPAATLPANVLRHRVSIPAEWAPVADSAADLGHHLVPAPLAKGSPYLAAARGTEFNSWHNIITNLVGSPFFTLVTGAHVQHLDWSSPQGRVVSATYHDRHSGQSRSLRGRAFVVAAGTINSTRLLLASRSADFPDGLGNTHDVLGRYLHDHPREWWPLRTAKPLPLPAHPLYMSRSADLSEFAASHTIGLRSPRNRPKTYLGLKGQQFGVQVFGTMAADPDMRVQLGAGPVDELDQPPIDIHFGYSQSTIASMWAARKRMTDVFAKAGNAAEVEGPGVDLTPGDSVHFGGSVRMHESPNYGMVDSYCRLHSAPNVQVVDASVFTTSPEKNPTLTAMAIASRAMDVIAPT